MSQPAKAQEPSMEEILASIRRIIADDDASRSEAKASEPAEPAPLPEAPAPAPRQPSADSARPLPDDEGMNQNEVDAVMARPEEPPADAAPEPASEILDLTESMAMSAPVPLPEPAPTFRTIDGEPDVVFQEPQDEPPPPPPELPSEPEPAIAEMQQQVPQGSGERNLLSTETSAAIDSAFNTLAHTVLVQNARTLEDLVREMLRPMLKAWLDDNLPGIVERLVRAEIERVSRGR